MLVSYNARKAGTMAKATLRAGKSSPKKGSMGRRAKRPTLAELTAWINMNHDTLLKKASANCVRLTGKPTFGGTRRKKSA